MKKSEVVFFLVISFFQIGNEIAYYSVVLKQYRTLSHAVDLNLQKSGLY